MSQFNEAVLTGAVFDHQDITQLSFEGARMDNVQITDCIGDHLRLGKAQAMEANFSNTRMQQSDFSEAQLMHANFSGTNLNESLFIKANCMDVNFSGAHLAYVNFSHANLQEASFAQAVLLHANMHRSDIERARFNQTDTSTIRGTDKDLAEAEDWKPAHHFGQ